MRRELVCAVLAFEAICAASRNSPHILPRPSHDLALTPLAQYPEELLAFVLQRTRERLEKRGVDINIIEDICTGTVLAELGGAKSGRLAALHAGMPINSAY
jgi:hypothetical protein